jgi:hypothetical protein
MAISEAVPFHMGDAGNMGDRQCSAHSHVLVIEMRAWGLTHLGFHGVSFARRYRALLIDEAFTENQRFITCRESSLLNRRWMTLQLDWFYKKGAKVEGRIETP